MDDSISRKAAIDLVEDIETRRLKGEVGLIYAPLIKGLRALPPAQPERKRGQWVERWHNNKHVLGDMACSVCGAQMLLTFPRFCPNCGADMRHQEGEE